MPKLSITNIGQATVVIKDLQGYSQFVAEVETGNTLTQDVTQDVLERITPELQALETPLVDSTSGITLVGITWVILTSDTIDDRAMGEGLEGLPSLNELQLAAYSPSLGATNAVTTGTGFLGNQVAATGSISNAANTAKIDLAAVKPGTPGNLITVAIATPAGGSTVVSVSSNAITVTPVTGGDTAANIASAINAHASAKLLVQATVGTAGSFTAAVAAQKLSKGIGPGVSLTLNGTACLLTEVTDTQLTFDIPTGISATGRIAPLEYREGPHVTRVSVPVSSGGGAPVGTTYSNTTRPTASTLPAGTMIFNTDDGAPNWSNGTNWVDASGDLT
jgi:hypothetical protein